MIYHVKNKLTQHTVDSDINKVATRNAYMSSVGYDFLRKYENGEWITGYNVLDKYNPTEVEKLLIEEKKELEKFLMKSLDESDPNNEFLLLFRIDKYFSDGTLPMLDDTNPKDLFTLRAALANGSIAPNIAEVGQGIYKNTQFYFESQEREVKKKSIMSSLRNKAGAIIEKFANTKEWLICIAFRLGLTVKPHFTEDTYYNLITSKLESLGTEKLLKEFILDLETPIALINNIFVAKQSIYEKVLKFDKDSKDYTFEGFILGRSQDEVLSYLSKEENEEVLNKVKNKVYKLYNVN